MAIVLVACGKTFGQVSVNVNIGTPPMWAPVGYDEVPYYYLPDVEAYYDVRASQFIYFGNGGWIRNRYLPGPYRHYDLYNGYKVVLNDYHGRTPYTRFNDDRKRYYKGYKGAPQKNRGERGHYDNGNHGGKGNMYHGNGGGKHGDGGGKHGDGDGDHGNGGGHGKGGGGGHKK